MQKPENKKVLNYDDYLDQAVERKQMSKKEAELYKGSTRQFAKKSMFNIMK